MEIKVLGISGSPIRNSNTEAFLKEALEAAAGIKGVQTELLALSGKQISDCKHCNWCVSKQEEGKFCSQHDDMTELFPKVLAADGLLIATPVYLARLSGLLTAFLDRLRSCLHGRVYRGALANKVGGALAVAWYRNAGLETALQSIFFAYSAFGVIYPTLGSGSACAWGAPGLSSEGGCGRFDPQVRLGVLNDEFGLRSAQSVGRRVAEVAQMVKAGQQSLAP